MRWIDFILMFGALQGILLMLAVSLVRKNRSPANKYLAFLIGLITLALLARLSYGRQISLDFPQILMIPDITLFVFGPTLYVYVKLLGRVKSDGKFKVWPHYIIAIVHFCLIAYFAVKPTEALWDLINRGVLLKPMYAMMIIGLSLNLFYILKPTRCFKATEGFAYNTTHMKSDSL